LENKLQIKITLILILIILFCAFTSLYFFHEWSKSFLMSYQIEEKFYSQDFASSKNIILLGSSQIGTLNMDYINQQVSDFDKEYKIYNLSISSDSPSSRIHHIDKITLMNPEIIVYGLGYRDFNSYSSIESLELSTVLPEPKKIFENTLKEIFGNTFDTFKISRLITFNVVEQILRNPDPKFEIDNFRPFFEPTEKEFDVMDKTEIELSLTKFPYPVPKIGNPNTNDELTAFKKIIETLQQNNIKVIIFSTPNSQVLLNSYTNSTKENFNAILEDLSNEYNIEVYQLQDKYSNIDIWSDFQHVSASSSGKIYSDEIISIILGYI